MRKSTTPEDKERKYRLHRDLHIPSTFFQASGTAVCQLVTFCITSHLNRSYVHSSTVLLKPQFSFFGIHTLEYFKNLNVDLKKFVEVCNIRSNVCWFKEVAKDIHFIFSTCSEDISVTWCYLERPDPPHHRCKILRANTSPWEELGEVQRENR